MKYLLRQILKIYLKFWAKVLLLIHRPIIVVVAGSINKAFFKDAIAAEIAKLGLSVRQNPKNFNTEIGMPLAILDLHSGYNSYRDWLPEIMAAPRQVFKKQPRVMVLSLGSAQKGDMAYLMTVVKPQAAVVVDITQRYLEGYADMNDMVNEYAILVRNVEKSGIVVLNKDNYRVSDLAAQARAEVKYFSIAGPAEAYAYDLDLNRPLPSFKSNLSHRPQEFKFFGRHHVQAYLAARLIKAYVAQLQ